MQLRQIEEDAPKTAGGPDNTFQPLPPGWEKKRDASTGKVFYVNHELKLRSWVDPRTPQEGWKVEAPPPLPSPAVAAHMPALAVADRVPVHVAPLQMPRVLVPKECPAPHAAIDYPPDQLWSMQREANAGGSPSASFFSAHDGAVPAPPLDFSVQRVANGEIRAAAAA